MQNRRTLTGLVKKSKITMDCDNLNSWNIALDEWNFDSIEDDDFVSMKSCRMRDNSEEYFQKKIKKSEEEYYALEFKPEIVEEDQFHIPEGQDEYYFTFMDCDEDGLGTICEQMEDLHIEVGELEQSPCPNSTAETIDFGKNHQVIIKKKIRRFRQR